MELKLPKNFPQAMGEGLIVLPFEPKEQQTAGGLVIIQPTKRTETDSPPQKRGIVCHVGPEVNKTIADPTTGKTRLVQKGDIVMFSAFIDSGFDWFGVFYISMSSFDAKVFLPSDDAIPIGATRKSNKRAATQKEDNKYR